MSSLHVGLPAALGFAGAHEWFDEPWSTAIFKRAVAAPVAVTALGLSGDGHADMVNHGGPDKAICVYPAVHYPTWQAELARADFTDGAFGENVTLTDLSEASVCIGDLFSLGRELLVQVSQPRQPCWKLARKWQMKDLTARAVASGRTGWYFRVLRAGTLQPGDRLVLQERTHPEWTVAAANLVMHHRVGDTRALAALPSLAASWQKTLHRRLAADSPPASGGTAPGDR